MNIPISVLKQFSYDCPKHNSRIILSDPDFSKGGMCIICLQKLTGMVSIEELQQNLKNIINKTNQENIHYIQFYKLIWNQILQLKMEMTFQLDKILQILVEQIKIIEISQQQFEEMLKSDNQFSLEKIQSQFEVQKNNYEEIINLAKQKLKEFQQKYFNIDQLLQFLDKPIQQTQFETLNISRDNFKIETQLINESKITESKECITFEFNGENNILLVACEQEILVYEFKNGLITRLLQRLVDHTGIVHCLYFMKQSNSFLSGSQDKSIIVWNLQNNQYHSKTILKNHQSNVICVLMNKKEDLLISGSYDFTVKFWKKSYVSEWNCEQTFSFIIWQKQQV